jgi:hypothetical protein
MTTYKIHDNGGRPFSVTVEHSNECDSERFSGRFSGVCQDGKATVYKNKKPKVHLLTLEGKVFVGLSPKNAMTSYSGGHGRGFDGNSILVCDGLLATVITSSIYSFTSLAPIVSYCSPVGNSDVPYPYAFDEEGNCYLMAFGIVVLANDELKGYSDPNDYYMDYHGICTDIGCIPPQEPKIPGFRGIYGLYLGNEPYTLTYKHNMDTEYDRWIKTFGPVEFVDKEGNRKLMDKVECIKFMEAYGEVVHMRGFSNVKQLVARRW